jgi:hypothetical protein
MSLTQLALQLPRKDGSREMYAVGSPSPWPSSAAPARTRVAFAAVHLVAQPAADVSPWLETAIDWEATLAFRRHIWGLGLSVAEGMDTAQRGMGLDWSASRELIVRSLALARSLGTLDRIACGAGTDQLPVDAPLTTAEVVDAYERQCELVEAHGGRIILMASRALATCASGADDYLRVYGRILSQVRQPVIIHWLGDMFDPALAGYWGSRDLDRAMDTCLSVVAAHADKVDGVKISLLDADREIAMRRRLPHGVRMYTGDDFNYPGLIAGDAEGASDALLGIFDAIAPAAAAGLAALDAHDLERFHTILEPTLPLARHIFAAPTRYYKTGVVFLAYLNGHQPHFRMVGGQESARSAIHLGEIFRLADAAGLLRDPELAVKRMRLVLELAGF